MLSPIIWNVTCLKRSQRKLCFFSREIHEYPNLAEWFSRENWSINPRRFGGVSVDIYDYLLCVDFQSYTYMSLRMKKGHQTEFRPLIHMRKLFFRKEVTAYLSSAYRLVLALASPRHRDRSLDWTIILTRIVSTLSTIPPPGRPDAGPLCTLSSRVTKPSYVCVCLSKGPCHQPEGTYIRPAFIFVRPSSSPSGGRGASTRWIFRIMKAVTSTRPETEAALLRYCLKKTMWTIICIHLCSDVF